MTVKTVQRREFEQSPGPLLDFVAEGNEVVIVEADKVQARLVATPTSARQPDRYAGQIWMAEDFDAPLPDSFWQGGEE